MYIDENQKDMIEDTKDKDGKTIKDIHAITYDEALAITGENSNTTGIRNTGLYYWLGSAATSNASGVWIVDNYGRIYVNGLYCWGVRPVVSLKSGVYIEKGTGTEEDKYILKME